MRVRTLLLFIVSSICVCVLFGCGDKPTPAPQAPAASFSKEPGPTDDDAAKEFTQTASGLKYRILRKSDKKKPTAADTVTVHYKGWLDDGTLFDASYGNPSGAATFPLNGVIGGWTEGVQYVGEGGMIELEIPPELGYGNLGAPPLIPSDAKLHFIVELLEIK